MSRIRANGVSGTIETVGGISAAATTFDSAGLASLPVIASPDVAAVVFRDPATGAIEIVHITAHASAATSATILRAQESTTAQAWAAGTEWDHGPTVADYTAVQSIVAGTNVTVDNTDPANPVVSASGGGGGGVGADRPLVDPTTYTWSWINQGVASIATQGASLLLSSPAESADSWHFRAKTVPAKPYSIIVHQKITRLDVNYSGAAVGWLQSSDNKFALFSQRGGGMMMSSTYSTAPFALTANYVEMSANRIWEWVKLTDDATSRKIYISADGYNWVLFHSIATNDTITPDRLVFGIEARNGTYGIGQTIDSWEEGA